MIPSIRRIIKYIAENFITFSRLSRQLLYMWLPVALTSLNFGPIRSLVLAVAGKATCCCCRREGGEEEA